jgi:hypothetical protein
MNKIFILLLGAVTLFAACEKDDIVPKDVQAINVAGVTNDTIKLTVADTLQLNVSTTPADAINALKYITNNARIFTVSNTGVITANGGGVGLLTIIGANGDEFTKKSVYIDVTEYVEQVTRNDAYKLLILATGGTRNISSYFTIAPFTATNQVLEYESSDPAVITVDSIGVVKYVSKGYAEVIAKSTDGGKVVSEPIKFYSGYATTALSRTGWTATASSFHGTTTYGPQQAINGVTTGGTFWHANWDNPVAFPLYYQIDFGEAKTFSEVEIYRRNSPQMDVKDIEFYIIPDDVTTEAGITWTDERYVKWGELSFVGGAVSGPGVDARNKLFQTFPDRKPVTSRYLMIKILNSNRNALTGDMSIAEIVPRVTQ